MNLIFKPVALVLVGLAILGALSLAIAVPLGLIL